MYYPFRAPPFPASDSINILIVILDGKACGFIIISGVIPVSVNGMSTYGHKTERTPF